LVQPLLLIVASVVPVGLSAQRIGNSNDGSLAGSKEIALFVTGRVLSEAYSVPDGKSAIGGGIAAATHLMSHFAVQAGLGVAYSRQLGSYYKPPLFAFTPTLSVIVQGATNHEFQPYAIAGGGYEFIRYTRPRCDCDQSRSVGIANVGAGVRKMIGDRRAFRFEASSQIASGGPAFSIQMGMSFFTGGSPRIVKSSPRPPERVRTEPPVNTPPRTVPVQPQPMPSSPTPAPQTSPAPAPAPSPIPAPAPAPVSQPATNLAGTVLLTIDGTQVDFNKTSWRDDAEPLLDGLAVDLTSDAGEKIKINIEGHTDNIGSKSGNTAIALDRAKAVREFLINQGISADRITVSSAGGDQPVAPNNTALGRQKNRRIVIRRTN
jgi:outer membrane protein OmpA-like peptidoglycan-associated protein